MKFFSLNSAEIASDFLEQLHPPGQGAHQDASSNKFHSFPKYNDLLVILLSAWI